jgi:hypothetical protein
MQSGDGLIAQFPELSIAFAKQELHESRRLVRQSQLVGIENIHSGQNRTETQLSGFAIPRHTTRCRVTAHEYPVLKDQ